MIVIEWILYGLFESAAWALEELRWSHRSPLSIIKLPLAVLVLITLFTPVLVVVLLLKLFDSTRRLIRGY